MYWFDMAKKVVMSHKMFGTRERSKEKYTEPEILNISLRVISDCNSKYLSPVK